MDERLKEAHDSLWWLAAAPVIWIAHLLASYFTAAIFCAKAAARQAAPLTSVRLAIGAYSALALLAIAAIALVGYRRHRYAGDDGPHSADTPQDRHRFVGFATCLLAGLAGIAVVYQALPALFFGSCH